MKTGLLSIHGEYADGILAGTKQYEFRRKAPRIDGPTRFLIYVPRSRKELVGEMLVTEVLAMPPLELWARTKEHAGIPKERFLQYFSGRDVAYALVIQETTRYGQPKHLTQLRRRARGRFTPPQFLVWLSPSLLAALLA